MAEVIIIGTNGISRRKIIELSEEWGIKVVEIEKMTGIKGDRFEVALFDECCPTEQNLMQKDYKTKTPNHRKRRKGWE